MLYPESINLLNSLITIQVFLSLMCLIDPLLQYDPKGVFCLTLVVITRLVQGLTGGLLNIIVQVRFVTS